jgi:SAM-dependent methyltransferase
MNNCTFSQQYELEYNNQAKQFNQFAEQSFSWNYIERPAFDQNVMVSDSQNFRIFEAGCGTGRIVKYLLTRGFLLENIVAMDISKVMIEEIKKNISGINAIKGSIDEIDFEPNNFDLVLSHMTLHHLGPESLGKALNNFYRMLKVGGNLYYMIPHPDRIELVEQLEKGWHSHQTPWGSKVTFYHEDIEFYLDATKSAGFDHITHSEPAIIDSGKVNIAEYEDYNRCPSRLFIKASKL